MNEKVCPMCGGLGRPASVMIHGVYECLRCLHRWDPARETVRGLLLPPPGAFGSSFSELLKVIRAETPWFFEPGPGVTIGAPASSILSGTQADPGWDFKVKSGPLTEKPEPDTEPPPVLEGSVIGYRAWRIDFKSWNLQGTGLSHGDKCWLPGVNEATCIHGCPVSPGAHCHCGFNALARFSNDEAWWSTADVNMHAEVVGAVEAWSDETRSNDSESRGLSGHFYLHSTGFRAQYARVVLLAIQEDWPRAKIAAVKALAAEHGADVCKRQHLADAAAEHGQLVPEELLRWAKDREPPNELEAFRAAFRATTWPTAKANATFASLLAAFNTPLEEPPHSHTAEAPSKGVSRKLKTPGPPGFGSFQKGDLVQDCKNRIYRCTRSGKGLSCAWERVFSS